MLIAKLPFILNVQSNFPLCETVRIRPVFLDNSISRSFGKNFDVPFPNRASSDCWSLTNFSISGNELLEILVVVKL